MLSVSSRALMESCERLGVDTDALLEEVGVERAVLYDPDGSIPFDTVRLLWRRAYELSGDPDLALHAAEQLPFGAYKVLDFLARHAPTIGGAFEAVSRYFPIINPAIELPIVRGAEEVRFGIQSPGDPAGLTRPYVEYVFAAVFLRTREARGEPFRLRAVEFAFPTPTQTSERERIFDCTLQFGTRASAMVLDREVWDEPNEPADADLYAVLSDYANLRVQSVSRDPDSVAQVRGAIDRQLQGGDPSLERVAAELKLSPRTLQRRLAKHSVRYGDLLDSAREGAARGYLSDPQLSVAEVAYLLGFSEQSSFNRAFKRWTGKAPAAYRRGA